MLLQSAPKTVRLGEPHRSGTKASRSRYLRRAKKQETSFIRRLLGYWA